VTIGISPKSFGFYYFNNLESQGNKFLKNIPDPDMALRLQQVILPGTDMNTSWLLSMETLYQNFGKEKYIKVNYDRYRLLQICAIYAELITGKSSAKSAIHALKSKITLREKIIYGFPLSIVAAMSLVMPKSYHLFIARLIKVATGSHPRHYSPKVAGKFRTILDVFENIKPAPDSIKKMWITRCLDRIYRR
jgi:hypothetical protein